MSCKIPKKSMKTYIFPFIQLLSTFTVFRIFLKVQVLHISVYMTVILLSFHISIEVFLLLFETVILNCSVCIFCGFFFCMLILWKKIRKKIFF